MKLYAVRVFGVTATSKETDRRLTSRLVSAVGPRLIVGLPVPAGYALPERLLLLHGVNFVITTAIRLETLTAKRIGNTRAVLADLAFAAGFIERRVRRGCATAVRFSVAGGHEISSSTSLSVLYKTILLANLARRAVGVPRSAFQGLAIALARVVFVLARKGLLTEGCNLLRGSLPAPTTGTCAWIE